MNTDPQGGYSINTINTVLFSYNPFLIALRIRRLASFHTALFFSESVLFTDSNFETCRHTLRLSLIAPTDYVKKIQ